MRPECGLVIDAWKWLVNCLAAGVKVTRGEFLEREILQIDPAVFADENNIWSFLVEELRAGVV